MLLNSFAGGGTCGGLGPTRVAGGSPARSWQPSPGHVWVSAWVWGPCGWEGLTLHREKARKGKLEIQGTYSPAVFLQLVGKDSVSVT